MPFITQGKTNWKFLLIVIILAIIVGGGALWNARRQEKPYQPSEIKKVDQTANWKTYSNKEYGFEVKYPNDWLVEPEDFPDPETRLGMVFGNYSIEEGDYEENYQSVILEVDEVLMDEFLTEAKNIGAKIEEITVASKNGYRFTTTGEEEDPLGIGFLPGIIVAVQNNNYIYIIGVVSPNDISEKVLNQMVSTFKFIEEEAVITKTEILARQKEELIGQAEKVQLADGTMCFFIRGATFVINGERANYDCSNNEELDTGRWIYGDLTTGDIWKANVASVKLDAITKRWVTQSTELVDIVKVWR